jgi:uncharacterized membrane protein YjjP (DUF1212 family)
MAEDSPSTIIRISTLECPDITCQESPGSTRRHDFLIALATDFSRYGAPAHRLEHRLKAVSAALGLERSFSSFQG